MSPYVGMARKQNGGYNASGAGSLGVGGLGEPHILLIMKKGYKQVMKKISNEIKRM